MLISKYLYCRPVVHCSGCPKSIAQRNLAAGYPSCPAHSSSSGAPCYSCHAPSWHTSQMWESVYSDSSVYYTDTDNI